AAALAGASAAHTEVVAAPMTKDRYIALFIFDVLLAFMRFAHELDRIAHKPSSSRKNKERNPPEAFHAVFCGAFRSLHCNYRARLMDSIELPQHDI
ncbi:hypothetical protein, partial [Aquabacterium sp.]|uniref:hypothetical protein n=1 Tax=Aquabacterium sp. TaxID=1872578 RepID=UPI0027BA01AC